MELNRAFGKLLEMVERFALFLFVLKIEVNNANWALKMTTLSLMYLINVEVHNHEMLNFKILFQFGPYLGLLC